MTFLNVQRSNAQSIETKKTNYRKTDMNSFQFGRGELLCRQFYVSWNVSNKIKNKLCLV